MADRYGTLRDKHGNTLESTPFFFHLEWATRTTKWYKKGVLPLKRTDLDLTINTNWDKRQIYLVLTRSKGAEYMTSMDIPFTEVSYLKSNLQKAIRRCSSRRAIMSAQTLVDIAPTQLLQRISIIMLEDVGLFRELPVVIWMMCALTAKDTKFKLTNSMVSWIYGLVYKLAEHPTVHNPRREEKLPRRYLPTDSHPITRDIFNALLLRSAHQCLKSDKRMLYGYIHDLCDTSLTSDPLIPFLKVPTLSPPRTVMQTTDWLPEAIDYHCIPKIIDMISEKYELLSTDDIKSAIWFHSSSLTFKKRTSESELHHITNQNATKETWNTIKRQFYSIGRYYLERGG